MCGIADFVGYHFRQEFAYPKIEATELYYRTQQEVPSISAEDEEWE
jgi:hypothetical protein